ncbi:MLO protein homolog 1-like [Apium graveolens]|uniref:MLO protein homolog 1-like n=1 Tax=Apium graveolens TaxID=4045 RepID=UPI003D7A3343
MAVGGSGERSLKETPSWAVALVCTVFIVISILIEHAIHILGKWFQKRQKKAMMEALEKIKAELMLLGFISLLITVGTNVIAKICIPKSAGSIMLPCKKEYTDEAKDKGDEDGDHAGDGGRKLLWFAGDAIARRMLAPAAADEDYCSKSDKVPLISPSGLHQLHIFIFVLAVLHIMYSVMTIGFAQAKLKKWKSWELETSSLEYQFTNDPSRFRFAHQTSFVRRHSGLSTIPGVRYIVAFFRQFFASVTKVDYMTMRHGFINAHFAPNSKFNFHKYIKRSMEDDFKVVVGISIPLWTFAIIFQLLNVYKWYTFIGLAFIPPTILLIVGAKLELIIMDMAQQIQDRTTVVKGVPVVQPSNTYFWFNRPHIILFLIHFTLFENAFQMAYFLWTWYEFGLYSCFHENIPLIITKVVLSVAFQVLCSYITFPLYALVIQMGSHMKQAIFEEQTANALKKWRKTAKQNRKLRVATERGDDNISGFSSVASTPSRASSPLPLLHKYKTGDIESTLTSPRYMNYHTLQTELSPDVRGSPPSNVSSDYEAKQNVKGGGSAFTFHSP